MKARRKSVTVTEEVIGNKIIKTKTEIASAMDDEDSTTELDYTVTIRR